VSIEFPDAWNLTVANKAEDVDADDSHSEDSEDETNNIFEQSDQTKSEGIATRRIAYKEFLRFLELGCSGSPSQGYPTIIIILSTIPTSVSNIVKNVSEMNSRWMVNRSLRLLQISSPPSGQQLMAVRLARSIAQLRRLHSYPPYSSARSCLSGGSGVSPEMVLSVQSTLRMNGLIV
jgi:hypothetical protein